LYWFAAQVAGDRRQHEVPLSALAGTAAQQVDATWANVSCGPPLCACAPKPKKAARKKKAKGGKKSCSVPGAQGTGSGSSDDSDGGSAGARRDKCPGDSKVTLVLGGCEQLVRRDLVAHVIVHLIRLTGWPVRGGLGSDFDCEAGCGDWAWMLWGVQQSMHAVGLPAPARGGALPWEATGQTVRPCAH
jgi:hypothetical protein